MADLSSVFFNLLDNAIEACNASGSQSPAIRLSANISDGFLTIYMHNTKNPDQNFNHKTSKIETFSHGYGLSIIEDICHRYNGSYQRIDHGNTFDSIVLLQIEKSLWIICFLIHLRNFGYASVSQKIPGGFFLRNFICIVFTPLYNFINNAPT